MSKTYLHHEFDKALAAGVTSEPEVIAVAGALSVEKQHTTIAMTAASNIALTLADGIQGQLKVIAMTVKGGAGNAVLTPANLADGTTLTFDTVGDLVVLYFIGTEWHVVVNKGATLA